MLIRAIALSLAMLVGIGTIIPFINEPAEAGPKYKKKKKKKLKKYSKAWWRWYKKEQRKKRAILARKRALRAKQILLARQRANRAKQLKTAVVKPAVNVKPKVENPIENVKAKVEKPYKKSVEPQNVNNELQFRVKDDNGNALGMASLTVVMPSVTTNSNNEYNKIGGVPTTSLRSQVVSKMVKEEGWVVNDYQKTINGRQVYIVIGQSQTKGAINSRLFYFTEVGGKIYSLSATCPKESQDRVALESERVIQSLQRDNKIAQSGQK